MGAKTWMLVYSSGNPATSFKGASEPNRAKTVELLQRLFPQEKLDPIADGDLTATCPDGNTIYSGYFSDVFIVAAKEFGIDYPSKLNPSFLNIDHGNTIHLHAMHSVSDWFAFAVWRDHKLERALSLSPDGGVLEDIGKMLPFEIPYWEGKHPAVPQKDLEDGEESYPLPFHPLELGEAALQEFFGYVLEGTPIANSVEAERVTLMGFRRTKKPKWKFW